MTTITIEQSLIEQAIESFVGYRREMRLMIGDEESEPCDAEKALCAALAAPESGAMTEIDYRDDNDLRFVQRVLEGDAPESDKKAARDMVVGIRTRVLKARAYRPAPDDLHRQELLAQDITLQNMRERHAQELCAYSVTVDKLRAEIEVARKGLLAVSDLINQSKGVSGLHLNGEMAPWGSLSSGGEFEGWLVDFDAAIAAQEKS